VGDNATIAFSLTKLSTVFDIASDKGEVILKVDTLDRPTYELAVLAADKRGHSSGLRTTRVFTV